MKLVKSFIILGIFLSFSIYSCKVKNKTGTTNNQKELVISMRKTACYGSCPVYTLEIFSDKKMHLKGESNIEKKGDYYNLLTDEEYNSLIQAFIDADFFNLKNEYTGNITDMPTTYISFSYNGKSKIIKDYYNSPAKLKQLEKTLDNYRKLNNWIKKDSLN